MAWQDRPYNSNDEPRMSFNFPKPRGIVVYVIAACFVVFLLRAITQGSGDPIGHWLSLTFSDGRAWTQPWRWITYQYVHAGALHLFLNMLAVYFFLPSLEAMWGWKKALAFYTLGGIAAGALFGLMQLVFSGAANATLVGASGSVLAAIGAVALLNPDRQLILLFVPVPIRVGAALFGAFFLLSAVADRNLSDAAHLGGLAFGFFAPWIAGPWMRKQIEGWETRKVARQVQTEIDEGERIDKILAKVHEQGMNSLNRGERNTLKRATERQRKADAEKARKRTAGGNARVR